MSVATEASTVGRARGAVLAPRPDGSAPTAPRRQTTGGRALTLLLLLTLLGACVLLSLSVGTRSLPLAEVWSELFAPSPTRTGEIVRELRAPRTLLGLEVGMALGVAGALMQAMTRNPLADPGLLGVNAGAATAVVIGIVAFGITSVLGYVWLAFAGAGLALLLVHALGGRGGSATPVRLALAGTAISATLLSLVAGLVLLSPGAFDTFRAWEVGSLSGRGQGVAETIAAFIALGLFAAFLLARPLNALALGDDTGRALGAHVGGTRAGAFVAIAVLSGAATAAAGPIGFLGLTVPHMARALVGPDHRWVLPCSALLAPCVLLRGRCDRSDHRPPRRDSGRSRDGVARRARVHRARAAPTDRCAVTGSTIARPTPPGPEALEGDPTRSRWSGRPHPRRASRRTLAVWGFLALLALIVTVLSLGTGDFAVAPVDVVRTLFGEGTQANAFIVETLRLPRVLCALLVGGALGASGAVFQTLTRNPLGSPDVIGFTWGAAAGAVLQIAILGGGAFAVSGSAILGGLLTAVAVYGLSLGHGPTGSRLILIGIGISALLAAVVTFVLARVELGSAQAARLWLTGSLNGRGWEFAVPMLAAFAILLPLLALLSRPLTMLELGDDAARALGVAVDRVRPALIVVAVGLCGCATAAAGPVPFVALAAPQLARRLTRASGPGLVGATLMGAVLLAGSDLVAQRILPTGGLPVGVMTGALGGAYLLWLLRHEWRHSR